MDRHPQCPRISLPRHLRHRITAWVKPVRRTPNVAPSAERARPVARARWLCVLVVVALVATSCQSRHKASLPRPPAAVNVSLREYGIKFNPPASAGRAVFRVRNGGSKKHELVLVPLPEGLPAIQEQVRLKVRRAVGTLALVKPLRPGGTAVLAVDLAPGRYGMVGLLEDSKGVSDAKKGMAAEFRVR